MKCDIILAGVGGQGILSIAASIGMAALSKGLLLKQAEVHGMSQRGGAVQSSLRISSKEIASDLIPEGKADMIISVEPMESLRYLSYLSPEGWLLTNSRPMINIPDYPDIDLILEEISMIRNHVIVDADRIAGKLGSRKASNMVMLGAAMPFIDIPAENFERGIREIFSRKGEEIVEINLAALKKGKEVSENRMQSLS